MEICPKYNCCNGDITHDECLSDHITELTMAQPLINGKTPWEFACAWYDATAMEWAVKDVLVIPPDVKSKEFAMWLVDNYRQAMSKGIYIGLASAQKEEGITTKLHAIKDKK